MSTTTQYIGERYVPIVADPVEWNANREYEHLTIVMHNGDSYISKQDVPKGAQITNTRYWLKTNDFNAQLNQAIGKANTAIQKADEALAKFPVSIANGGTGKTTATEAWAALGGGSIGKKNALSASDIPSGIDVSKITGTLDVAHGGTGVTTAQAERNRLGLGNTTDALPVANGGTGSTNAAAARTALDAAQSGGAAGTLYAAEQAINTLFNKGKVFKANESSDLWIGDLATTVHQPYAAFYTDDRIVLVVIERAYKFAQNTKSGLIIRLPQELQALRRFYGTANSGSSDSANDYGMLSLKWDNTTPCINITLNNPSPAGFTSIFGFGIGFY